MLGGVRGQLWGRGGVLPLPRGGGVCVCVSVCACVSVCVRARAPLRATRSVAAPATSVLHGFVAAARGPTAGLACAGGSEVCHGAGVARLSHLARRVGGTGDAPTPEGPRAPGSRRVLRAALRVVTTFRRRLRVARPGAVVVVGVRG